MYLPSIIRKGLSKYSFMVWATLTILCLWAPLQKSEWFIRETANLEIQYRFGIQTYLTTYSIVPSLNHLVESPLILGTAKMDLLNQVRYKSVSGCKLDMSIESILYLEDSKNPAPSNFDCTWTFKLCVCFKRDIISCDL